MLLVNINAHAQASAESLPAELSRVDFHLSHLCPIVSQYVLASARRVRYSVRSRTSFLLPPVFRSTIASLRSATIKGTMQDLLKNMSHHQAEPKTFINREPLYNFENSNHNGSTLS